MTIKSIIDIENNRIQDEDFYNINLFKEGEWWSAYELSAFICHFYKNTLNEKLKINKKHLKSENIDFIKTGLKETSFEKYLPNFNNNIKYIDEKHAIINAKDFIDYDINKDNYLKLLNDLKEKLNINNKETETKIKTNNIENNNKITLFDIFNDIIKYDINNKTNEELIDFINYLKENINKILLKVFL